MSKELREAKERIIKTLIDSGGDDWEYNSLDIQSMINYIEKLESKLQAVKDSLYTDEEIGDIANMRVLKDEKPFRLIDVALNQKNRVLKALNKLRQ